MIKMLIFVVVSCALKLSVGTVIFYSWDDLVMFAFHTHVHAGARFSIIIYKRFIKNKNEQTKFHRRVEIIII